MKSILTGVRDALRAASALSMVDDESVYITPDEALFFIDKAFPQVAVSDGKISYVIEEGQATETELAVTCTIYQELKEGDQSLMGGASPGVLDIVSGIHGVLFDNRFDIPTIEEALPVEESEASLVMADDIALVKKTVTYQYRKLTENP